MAPPRNLAPEARMPKSREPHKCAICGHVYTRSYGVKTHWENVKNDGVHPNTWSKDLAVPVDASMGSSSTVTEASPFSMSGNAVQGAVNSSGPDFSPYQYQDQISDTSPDELQDLVSERVMAFVGRTSDPEPFPTNDTSHQSLLRSSRSTRNQDHSAAARNRPGNIDFDPTDGLPVGKFQLEEIVVNQDVSFDAIDPNQNNATTDDAEAHWPELPMAPWMAQLPAYTQELLRRARRGNPHAKLSVWDNRSESWIPGHVADAKNTGMKSKHLRNLDPESPTHNEDEDDDEGDDHGIDIPGSKKRKVTGASDERTFVAKKWVKIPGAIAEKMGEKKYLADRRPGMESLYGGAYKNTNGYGAIGVTGSSLTGVTGFDLGDGSGLGNAAGVLTNGDGNAQATPVRKNMPPKRKKKKLGGPGRKKAVPVEGTGEDVSMANGNATENGETGDKVLDDAHKDDGDEDDGSSESEGEGSEEGEIDEGNGEEKPKDVAMTEAPIVEVPAEPTETEPEPATTAQEEVEEVKDIQEQPAPQEPEPTISEIPEPAPPVEAVLASENVLDDVPEPAPIVEEITETAEAEPIPVELPEPVTEPASEPAPEPTTELAQEPVTESLPEPVEEPVPEPIAEEITAPVEVEAPIPAEEPIEEEKTEATEPAVVETLEEVAEKTEKSE